MRVLVKCMTKKKFKKNRRGFVAIPFNAILTLGALVTNAIVIVSTMGSVFGEDIYIISVDATWSLRNFTAAEGPVHVGYTHSDLSTTEVQENLDAELSNPDDIIAKERSRRPVRKVGTFSQGLTDQSLNDGKVLRSKIKFSVGDGFNLDVYAINRGANLTTGGIIHVSGTIYGRWQR